MKTIILPGMGADSDMYSSAHYKNQSGVLYINWPSYKGEQSVPEVASRIIKEQKLNTDDIVGGSSLGGMVAAEIARQIKMKKLILIGSTLLPKYVNPALQKLSDLSDLAPVKLIQILAGKVNISLEKPLLAMFSNADSQFIKAMCKAIFKWEGNEFPTCEVAHIHGTQDKVIYPPPNGADIINDGGHLIAMSHSSQVAEFIRGMI